MRYVTIPAPVECSGKSIPFSALIDTALRDQKWGVSLEGLQICLDLRRLRLCEPGHVEALSDAEHEALSAVIRQPTAPYNPELAEAIVKLAAAVLDAPMTRPSNG